MQDKVLKVLKDLRVVLVAKRSSLTGVVGNQATASRREGIQYKIDKLTEKIDELNDCITLRLGEYDKTI